MLLRFSLSAAGAVLVASGAMAQSGELALPITSPVKDAGTYHMATDTWTRGSTAAAWNDVIFDNSCSGPYYGGRLVIHRVIDDGRIPSTTSPYNHSGPYLTYSYVGFLDSYTVNMFQIGYCTFEPQPVMEINFWQCFSGCVDNSAITPDAGFQVTVPGSGSGLGCWVVNVDLVNSSDEFAFLADCDGAWNGGAAADTFGWSWQQVTASTGGTPGPLIAGDPKGYTNGGPASSGCDMGANTVFYTGPMANPGQGTGLSGLDQFERHAWTSPIWVYDGCWFYGGYPTGAPYSNFHMVMYADAQPPVTEPGVAYCPGDGTGTSCAYSNNSSTADPIGGCLWTFAGFPDGGILGATGVADVAVADVTLVASDIQNNFGIFFAANNRTNGGLGIVLNDGLRCAGGGVIRLTPPTPSGGNVVSHGPVETSDPGAIPGATRRYQYWFRSPGGPGGQMANLTNGYEIVWL